LALLLNVFADPIKYYKFISIRPIKILKFSPINNQTFFLYKKEQIEGNLLKMSTVSYEKMDFDELSQNVNFKCMYL